MSKTRICLNCAHYEDRGVDILPMGDRGTDLSGSVEARVTGFAPRCLKGLNPSLAHAPQNLNFIEREVRGFEPDAMAAFCDSYVWTPPISSKFRSYVRRRVEKDPRFSTIELPEKFIRFWEKGQNVRIKIERGINLRYNEYGYVSISIGWQPAFLLVKSVKAKHSSVLLKEDDLIVGVREWNGKSYSVYRDLA